MWQRGFNHYQVVYNFHMLISTRDQVITKIKAHRRALKRYGVKSLALFGSTARDKIRKRSDIDVLVQFDKSTWANYIGLKFYLEDLLGREVDLVTPKAIKPATKPSIEKDLLYVVS
jgi:predicted nucleotidyltransferase